MNHPFRLAGILLCIWISRAQAFGSTPVETITSYDPTLVPDVYNLGDVTRLSDDGSFLLLGAPFSANGLGIVSVWQRVWDSETFTEVDGMEGNNVSSHLALFGSSVDITGGNEFIAIGAPGDADDVGSVTIYHYDPLTSPPFTLSANLSAPNDQIGSSAFGSSIQWCNGTSTLVVGGSDDHGGIGATWVFAHEYSGGVSTLTELQKLVGTGFTGGSSQGKTLAVSSDCSTIVVGAPWSAVYTGAVWIFQQDEGGSLTWSQQGSPLSQSTSLRHPYFGTSLSLSSSGSRLAVGGPADNYVGGVWIFDQSGGTWSNSAYLTITPVGTIYARMGESVALSADGLTLYAGAPGYAFSKGSIVEFTNTGGSTWVLSTSYNITGVQATPLELGTSMSLNGNSTFLATGADGANFGAGKVFIWA